MSNSQVPNPSPFHNTYARPSQNLSETELRAQLHEASRGPVDVGIGIHFAEIHRLKLLGYIAWNVVSHKHALIERVLLNISDPRDRAEFALTLTIADAIDVLRLHEKADNAHSLNDALPPFVLMPGIMPLWPATLADALAMLAGNLHQHSAAIAALPPELETIDAVHLAWTLRIAECISQAKDSDNIDTATAQLLIEQLARWTDQWALLQLHPKITRAELNAELAKRGHGKRAATRLHKRSRR